MTIYEVSVNGDHYHYYLTRKEARETRDIIEQGDEEVTIDSIEVNNEEELCALLTELGKWVS